MSGKGEEKRIDKFTDAELEEILLDADAYPPRTIAAVKAELGRRHPKLKTGAPPRMPNPDQHTPERPSSTPVAENRIHVTIDRINVPFGDLFTLVLKLFFASLLVGFVIWAFIAILSLVGCSIIGNML